MNLVFKEISKEEAERNAAADSEVFSDFKDILDELHEEAANAFRDEKDTEPLKTVRSADALTNSEDPIVAKRLEAANCTDPIRLDELSNDPDDEIKQLVANNENTNVDTLVFLRDSEEASKITRALAQLRITRKKYGQ